MSGDLVSRLRGIRSGDPVMVACILDDLCQEAATLIEAQAAEIERLKGAWKQQNGIIASQAQQIEDGRAIYDAALRRAETAERALAEAVEVIMGLDKTFRNTVFHPDASDTGYGHVQVYIGAFRAARNFVKEHGALTAAQNGGEDAGEV